VTEDRVRALTGASGLAAAALIVVAGFVVPPDQPDLNALPEQVARWTLDDRRRLLVATVLFVGALSLLIAFYVGLRAMVGRAEGAPALLATMGYGAALVAIALWLLAVGLLQLQSIIALDGDPGWVRTIHDGWFVVGTSLAAGPTIVSTLAFGFVMVRSGFPARWLGWFSLAVAVMHGFRLLALARSGALAPTSAVVEIAGALLVAWWVVVSLELLLPRRAR
jgi:hypothetical protein